MKHLHPLSLAAVTLALLISACSQPDNLWTPNLEPQFGSAVDDRATDVSLNRSGYIHVVGNTSPTGSDGPVDPAGIDGFLRRYDRDGKLIWARKVGGSLAELVHAVDTDASGNGYIAWSTVRRTDAGVFEEQGYLSKYGASGTLLWTRKTASVSSERQQSLALVAVDPLGGVYAADEQQVGGYVLQKYSSSGTLLWQKRGADFLADDSSGFAVGSDGSLYISDTDLVKYSRSGGELWRKNGVTRSPSPLAVSGADDVYLLSRKEGFDNSFVTKYTASGMKRWEREVEVFTDGGYVDADGFDADTSGNLYVTGSLEEYQAEVDIIVQKLDQEAKPVWLKRIDSSEIDYANAVSIITGDAIYVAGETYGLVNGSNRG